MAEAVGLAFGGIALAGMVSACVDILEYTSNARYWLCDLSLALTKVALLQYRLESLDRLREIYLAASAGGYNDGGYAPRAFTPHLGCEVATQGLSGVKSVLEQTNKLCRRYSLAHMEEGKHNLPSHRSPHFGSHALPDAHLNQPQLFALRPWRRLGRQICWAFQDKKKFEKLILDLDFLLSNTEYIFNRTPPAGAAPVLEQRYSNNKSQSPPNTSQSFQISGSDTLEDKCLPLARVKCTQLEGHSMSSSNLRLKTKQAANTPKLTSGTSKLFSQPNCSTQSDGSVVVYQIPPQSANVMQADAQVMPGVPRNTFSRNTIANNSGIAIHPKNNDAISVDDNKLDNFASFSVGGFDALASNPTVLKGQCDLAREQNRNKGLSQRDANGVADNEERDQSEG